MEGSALKEMVEFHLLQASWSKKAFLVTRGDVTGSRLALGFRFGAFKNDDLAWHGSLSGGRDMDLIVPVVKRNSHRILIFFRGSTAEADFIGRTEAAIAVFLLPFRLTFHGQTGEWYGFQAHGRNLVL